MNKQQRDELWADVEDPDYYHADPPDRAKIISLLTALDRADGMRDALRDDADRRKLLSLPRKTDFMHERGMKSLEEVHDWMCSVVDRLEKTRAAYEEATR